MSRRIWTNKVFSFTGEGDASGQTGDLKGVPHAGDGTPNMFKQRQDQKIFPGLRRAQENFFASWPVGPSLDPVYK